MVLQLLGFVAVVVFTYFVFKTAKEYGRPAGLWALATVAVGIGLQLVVPIMFGIVISIVLLATGTDPNRLTDALWGWAFAITFVCLALSVVGMFLILRYVANIPDDSVLQLDNPPPPPTFEG